MEIVKMNCKSNIVLLFLTNHFHKTNDEYEEMKQHIIYCKQCFEELIKLAPKYDQRVEE